MQSHEVPEAADSGSLGAITGFPPEWTKADIDAAYKQAGKINRSHRASHGDAEDELMVAGTTSGE